VIARIWRGETRAEDADAYQRYLEETGERDCRALPGNRGVLVLRGERDERAEFVFVSFWESMDAVRAFAGDDLERARYYPQDYRYLLTLEPFVRHFEVASPAWTSPRPSQSRSSWGDLQYQIARHRTSCKMHRRDGRADPAPVPLSRLIAATCDACPSAERALPFSPVRIAMAWPPYRASTCGGKGWFGEAAVWGRFSGHPFIFPSPSPKSLTGNGLGPTEGESPAG
jgi:heme-degrading monooxygenase HmoA